MWGSEKHILDAPHLIQSIFLNDPGQLANDIETSPLPDGPNFADEQRRTLLHAAAFCGNVHITRYLLEKGARVNAKDASWITPLHRVCCREEVPDYRGEDEAIKGDLGYELDRPSPPNQKIGPPGSSVVGIFSEEPVPQMTISHFPNGTTNISGNLNSSSCSSSSVDGSGSSPLTSLDSQGGLLLLNRNDWKANCARNENAVGLVRCNSHSFQAAAAATATTAAATATATTAAATAAMTTTLTTTGRDQTLYQAYIDDEDDWGPNYGETCAVLLEAGADVSARDKLWQTPLHVAAANNALTCAEVILSHQEKKQNSGLNFNFLDISDKFNRTSLHHAVFNGHVQMAQLLLEHGANPDILDKRQRRPAHYAAFLGHDEMLKLLVEHGAQLEVFDQDRLTPLHAACAGGRVNALQSLLSMGARLDVTDSKGNTGLHICCLNGKVDVAQSLIAAGSPLSVKNALGYTPLHYAAASTHGGTCVELLLNMGALVNAKSGSGRTPLHMSAIHGRVTRAQNLISAGAQLNTADRHGLTTLHIAARYGHELLVKCLINKGANASATSRDGSSALHLAALYGHYAVCHKLLSAGADVLGRDNQGRTPIHCAAFAGNLDLASVLVNDFLSNVGNQFAKKVAIEAIVDANGRTPLHYAVSNRNQHRDVNLLVYLNKEFPLDAGRHDVDGRTPLHLACSLEDDLYVNFFLGLLKADEWCKLLDNSGAGPLHYAAFAGNCQALQAILSQLAPKDIRAILGSPPMCPTQRLSPLELAASGGHLQCLRLLLEFATREDDEPSPGKRPDMSLVLAAKHNKEECLMYLLNCGLYDVNLTDKRGRTALMYAAMRSSGHAIRALLEQGAEVNIEDHRGLGVLHYAFNNYEATKELLETGASILTEVKVPCKSALHLAALSGNAKVLAELIHALRDDFEMMSGRVAAANGLSLRANSVMSLRDPQGYSALHYACYSGNRECVGLLLEKAEEEMNEGAEMQVAHRAHFTELHCAAGHLNGVSLLESILHFFGMQALHAKDAHGRTALHIAAIRGVVRNCDLLIIRRANIDEKDNQGCTPLMLAAQYGQCNVIEHLLRREADPCVQDIDGNSSLHHACMHHQETVIQLLLEKKQLGKLVNLSNHEGCTALHLAARNGLVAATQLLIVKGADVVAKDKFGHTPALCCATNAQVARCLKLILDVSPLAFSGSGQCPAMPSPPLSEEEEENCTQ